jgi:predicted MPP superfamily phosphohydrolase
MRKRLLVIAAVAVALCYAGLVEPNWLKVRTFDLSVPGLGADLTIVHIADVHTNYMGFRERRVLDIIDKVNPDYVFMTGDLLKSNSQLKDGLAFLAGLSPKRGVYMVPGNADAVLLRAIEHGEMPKAFGDWRVLMNESIDCGPFTLVGIDDPVRCRDNVAAAMRGVTADKPIFVLTHFHAKRVLASLRNRGVALIFSGHTHGGQIGFGPLVSHITYAHRSKYVAGLYTVDGTRLYVTRGVGTNLFPLRIACRPEVVIFHLRGD